MQTYTAPTAAPPQQAAIPSPARNTRRVCSFIGFGFAAMMLAWRISAWALNRFVGDLAASWMGMGAGPLVLNDIALYGVGLPVFLLVLHFIPQYKGPLAQHERMRVPPWKYILIVLFSFGIMYLCSMLAVQIIAVVELFKFVFSPGRLHDLLEQAQGAGTADLMGGMGWPLRLLLMVIVPATGEEFVFRFLLRKKLRGSGDRIYILISGVTFGLFHGNLQQAMFATVLGMVFAWVYLNTGNMLYPISLHFIVNLMGAVLLPELMDVEPFLVGYMLLMLALIAGASIAFVQIFDKIWRRTQPPEEPGWPYKASKPKRKYLPEQYYRQRAAAARHNHPPPASYPAYPAPPYGAAPQQGYASGHPAWQGAQQGMPLPLYTQGQYTGTPGSVYPGQATPQVPVYGYPGQPPAAYGAPPQPPYPGGSPYGTQPGAPPYGGAPQPQPYTAPYGYAPTPPTPAPAAPQDKIVLGKKGQRLGSLRFCFGSAGMLLFLLLSALLIVATLVLT